MCVCELSDEETLTTTFIDRFEAAREAHMDIGHVTTRVLKEILGQTGAHAVIYTIGEDSLNDPGKFAHSIRTVFGLGAQIILKRLLLEYEKFALDMFDGQNTMLDPSDGKGSPS